MSERRVEGSLPGKVSFLIAAACVVTVLVAATGMKSIWDVTYYASSRDAFWYCNGIALGLTGALALAFLPRWHLPRLVRVAVLVPVMHLGALIVAVKLWAVLRADTWAYLVSVKDDNSPVPTLPDFALAIALVVVAGMLIARRRGEWAHASMMLALSTLLLVGLWLPIVCSWWSTDDVANVYANIGGGHRIYLRSMYSSYENLRLAAILPPVIAAIAFTTLVFRRRMFFSRHRARVTLWVKILFAVAMLAQVSGSDRTGLLYLEHTYIILFVVGLVIGTFVVFGATTWLDSWRAHRALARKPRVDGTIATDGDAEPIATLEITSWLRGPRLATRTFAVRTPSGDVPVTTGNVILPMPPSTLALGVGETAGVLSPGDAVTLAADRTTTGADPFRTMDAAQIAGVISRGATRYRFSDVALVVWRPAVAYLAILVAVALPGIAMLVF
ncbi:MAG: hypothetical protein HOV81_10275 [Kofleriaceae bacterium]|nr:hypothetical protein [Kofleriaceae bacterium]